MLKAIHAQESRQAAEAKAAPVVAELGLMKLSKLVEWMTTSVADTLAYLAFPSEHWRRIRTNNPLERIMRQIRRRTRVVGAFPDGESALNPLPPDYGMSQARNGRSLIRFATTSLAEPRGHRPLLKFAKDSCTSSRDSLAIEEHRP
jgi:transposase-like protein